jgi:hypothetical protein
MRQVSPIINVFFALITFLTVWQFYRASKDSRSFLLVSAVWMAIQLLIGRSHFYENGYAVPPRFALLLVPPLLLMIGMFIFPAGRKFIDRLDPVQLTLLHSIRIGVEIILYLLFIAKAVPKIMTFEGRNFDLIAGLTAPLVFYFGYVKKQLSGSIIIGWNFLSLCLLVNIILIAIFSAATPLQRFGFDQPNIAIAHFPFNWLPSVVVPIVLFSHLALLRQSFRQRNS